KRHRALARQRNGPLAEERGRYLAFRAGQGMPLITLQETAHYLLMIARHLRLADRPVAVFARDEIEQEARHWPGKPAPRPAAASPRARALFLRYAVQWLRFLGRLQPTPDTPHPFATEIAGFAEYLNREKGLAPTTIGARCWTLRAFLG